MVVDILLQMPCSIRDLRVGAFACAVHSAYSI